jgi:hypothetical protein
MKTKQQHFVDTTYSLAKSLHHINNAKLYFEDISRDCSGMIKHIFLGYINKCDFIINGVKDRLGKENVEQLKKELADSFVIEAINDKLVHLNNDQKQLIENLIDAMIKGEKVIAVNDLNETI